VEKNVFSFALNYNWPPGSWDNLSIAQFCRLLDREHERIEERRTHTESVETTTDD
jgi:hypothetical protein